MCRACRQMRALRVPAHARVPPLTLFAHLAGVCAVGLVRDLLQARPNAKALFVPAEITT